jgi:hypothetical protein
MADSAEPGKLSGPNTVSLLSNIGLLTNSFSLTNIGLLIHNIIAQCRAPVASPLPSTHAHTHIYSRSPLTPTSLSVSLSQSLTSLSAKNTSSIITTATAAAGGGGGDSVGGALGMSPLPEYGDYCPSLSFEEFLVFLYAYSELKISHSLSLTDWSSHFNSFLSEMTATMSSTIITPMKDNNNNNNKLSKPVYAYNNYNNYNNNNNNNNKISSSAELWFQSWQKRMLKSSDFKTLLQSLSHTRQTRMVASPEEARNRDQYIILFALDVITAIQKFENMLYQEYCQLPIETVSCEKQVDLICGFLQKNGFFMTLNQVIRHVYDVQPESHRYAVGNMNKSMY